MKLYQFITIVRIVVVSIILSVLLLTGCGGRTEGGPPGVVVGADSFKSTLVSPLVGWVQTGIYDSGEGLEIAVLSYGKITFLDPKTYAVKRTVPVHDNRVAYKTLVSLRADGNLNLMAGGGGFSEVGLYDLGGKRLWDFKVQSKYNLNPRRMIAVDLDEDGIKEFYVADSQGVFRLDPEGRTVWHSDISGNHYILSLPSDGDRPAVVVTDKGMWDAQGNLIVSPIPTSVGTYMLQSLFWNSSYHLASGQTSSKGGHVFIFDLVGNVVFKQSIGNWGVNDIYAVRFNAEEPPYLVVVGGRGGGTFLMSLNIYSHDGALVYQENRRSEKLIVISDDAAGVDTLLLCTGGIKRLEKL